MMGPYLEALIAAIRQGSPQDAPTKGPLHELLRSSIPADLRALLEARLTHRHNCIAVGDCEIGPRDLQADVPRPGGGVRTDYLVIGIAGDGAVYVVPTSFDGTERATPVSLVSIDYGAELEPFASSLDEMIANLVYQAEERELPVDITLPDDHEPL